MGTGARNQGREPGQGTRAVPVGGGGMWGPVQVSALSWCGLGGVVSHLPWKSLQSRGSCRVIPEQGDRGEILFPFWGTGDSKPPRGFILFIHHSPLTQNVIAHPGPSVHLLSRSITLVAPEGKAKPSLHAFGVISATKTPFKLTVSSLASPALMWCKSTSFNNQIMKAQHKKWLPLCSHPDPSCIKPWQRASLPLSVTLLKKMGAK